VVATRIKSNGDGEESQYVQKDEWKVNIVGGDEFGKELSEMDGCQVL
jgi:hypothetical protein